MKTMSRPLPNTHDACTNMMHHGDVIQTETHADGEQPFLGQLYALGWIFFVWIVGTIVFEFNVVGAEPEIDDLIRSGSLERRTMLSQMDQHEQSFAITHAGMDGFLRVERDSRLRPVFEAVIASAEVEIAQREKMLAAKEAENFSKMIKQVVHSFQELMAPVRIAQVGSAPPNPSDARAIKPTHQTREQRDKETSAVAASVTKSTPVDTVRVAEAATAIGSSEAIQGSSEAIQGSSEAIQGSSEAIQERSKAFAPQIVRVSAKPVVVPPLPQDKVETLPSPAMASASSVAHERPVDHAPVDARIVETLIVDVSSPQRDAADTPSPNRSALNTPVAPADLSAKTVRVNTPQNRVAARWPLLDATVPRETNSVSLNVDKAEVRGILELLARGHQMNILVAPDVAGTVTANVDGLTPEQALDGITKMCNLNLQREGDLIYVYPDTKLPATARELQVFPLDFVSGETLEPIVQGLLSPVGNAFVSKVDSEDNRRSEESIVVVDIPEVLAQVEQFITQTDRAPRQVMIEANILEVQLSDDMQHGVDFGSLLGGDLTISASGLASSAPSATNPLFFAQIDGSRIDSLVDILETTTDSKTLASPRVQVINGQNARIQVGEQLGYKVAAATQTAVIESVEFLETGIVLTVTPTISADNRVLLKVKPEVSDGQRDPTLGVPEKTTREVDTSVLLENHQGLVIGGLIRERDETVIRKLPWLGDVRHVGKFFQRREALRSRTEIVIALTCHIAEICDCVDGEAVNVERTKERLFQNGGLLRNHRPWEPRLPDPAGQTDWMDVKTLNQYIP